MRLLLQYEDNIAWNAPKAVVNLSTEHYPFTGSHPRLDLYLHRNTRISNPSQSSA
jgi:hypothetical protein